MRNSPGPKDRRVDEGWPTGGVRTSFYSRHKAEVERILDHFARDRASDLAAGVGAHE